MGSYGTWQVSYRVGSHMKLVMVSVSVSSSLLCCASVLPPSFHCYASAFLYFCYELVGIVLDSVMPFIKVGRI